MNITFSELRDIKHRLPTGSINRMASELGVEEQTIRNYFGANKFGKGDIVGNHLQPGPDGGVMNIEDTTILEAAKRILSEASIES